MLMRESRTLAQRVKLALWFSGGLRSQRRYPRRESRNYQAVDLGLEGSLLAGMVGGYVTGCFAGILISIPAMFNGELMSMPLFAGVGVLGGLLRDLAPEKEDIWRFSPFFDLNLSAAVQAAPPTQASTCCSRLVLLRQQSSSRSCCGLVASAVPAKAACF